ncbi:hypothetical protein THIOSC15_80003 [uncultured Thiomicrorhabdus sp.]
MKGEYVVFHLIHVPPFPDENLKKTLLSAVELQPPTQLFFLYSDSFAALNKSLNYFFNLSKFL